VCCLIQNDPVASPLDPRLLFPLIQYKEVAVVDPVELWATRLRRPSEAANSPAFRAAFTIAEGALCAIAEQAALKVAGQMASFRTPFDGGVSAPLL
jgi:hypothetical protein